MGTIWVVGLGPGDASMLPLGTYQQLQSGMRVVLRTRVHPVVRELETEGLTYISFDELYETGDHFAEIYTEMAERLISMAQSGEDLVYAVPGHPLMAEQSVQHLIDYASDDSDVSVVIGAGYSFFDAVCTALHLDPIEGTALLDGTALTESQLTPDKHLLIAQVFNRMVASEVKLTLMSTYPDDYEITVVRAAGVPTLEEVKVVPLYELDRLENVDHLTTVYVPRTTRQEILSRDPWFPAGLVHRLRQPDGCPWDREQTHRSLRKYVLEEAYEVAHAIDEEDPHALVEELGDLLLQILLHSEIAGEWGDFTVRDVYDALSDKLIRRHPHVFGEVNAETADEAEAAWRRAKSHESAELNREESALDSIRMGRPASLIASEIQEKTAKLGFDWPDIGAVLEKLQEEIVELSDEIRKNDQQRAKNELGDVLFVIVNLARWLDFDVEETLSAAIRKFVRRFRIVERRTLQNGGWSKVSSKDLENYWEEAKSTESGADQ
jgi:tetrapyrrole methylase family protein / MazG family protein